MAKAKTKVKIKTVKGAAKRFKRTGSGKYRFRRAERAHGNTKVNSSKVRARRRDGVLSAADTKVVDSLLAVNR